ncbi:MAG: FHIPEP family type III secretion protein, partial [Stenotrophomonas sp.]
DGPSNVGKDIGSQVLAQPRALLIAAAVALGMGMIPGMPLPVFLVLAVVVGGIGFVTMRGMRRVVDAKTGAVTEVPAMLAAGDKKPKPKNDGSDEFAPTVPLLMDVAADLQTSFDSEVLNEELLKIRRALYFWACRFRAYSCVSTRRWPPRATPCCCPKYRCRRGVCAPATCWCAKPKST